MRNAYLSGTVGLHAASGTLYSLFIMRLHVPAGACIPVASASPVHVFPIQCVLKHCGAHKHSLYMYTHT